MQAIDHGVKRFLLAGTVVTGKVIKDGNPHDDFQAKQHTGFWPHLDYPMDLDDLMRENSNRGTQMVTMRLGHFVGAGNRLGILPALVPRLKTFLVPCGSVAGKNTCHWSQTAIWGARLCWQRSPTRSGDNKSAASRLLGVSERNLWYKIKKHSL